MAKLKMFHDEKENKTYLAVLIDFSELMPILTEVFHIRGQKIQDILNIAKDVLAGKGRKK
jgi:hypothetical protein